VLLLQLHVLLHLFQVGVFHLDGVLLALDHLLQSFDGLVHGGLQLHRFILVRLHRHHLMLFNLILHLLVIAEEIDIISGLLFVAVDGGLLASQLLD